MIIHKNPISVEIHDDFPNTNFSNNPDVFVIDDRSELGKKISQNAPYFEFILDAEGNLIDITPTERPPELLQPPTPEERLQALEDAMLMITLGGM